MTKTIDYNRTCELWNDALKEFIALFLRNLFVLNSVPGYLYNLALKIHELFVGTWHSVFNAIIAERSKKR